MTSTIQTEQPVSAEEFEQQWRAWHTHHEAVIGDPHGFLAVTSLNWLTEDTSAVSRCPR